MGPMSTTVPARAPARARPATPDARPVVGLFWRLFIPNAIVLGTACVVLMVQPPNGRVPVLVAGLAVMLAVNVLLLRRAVTPLVRLTELMRRVDPLAPGKRIPPTGPPSEVTVLAEAFNAMLDRLEDERSASGRRALSEAEAERRRIAAELHDLVGHSLTVVLLSSRAPAAWSASIPTPRPRPLLRPRPSAGPAWPRSGGALGPYATTRQWAQCSHLCLRPVTCPISSPAWCRPDQGWTLTSSATSSTWSRSPVSSSTGWCKSRSTTPPGTRLERRLGSR